MLLAKIQDEQQNRWVEEQAKKEEEEKKAQGDGHSHTRIHMLSLSLSHTHTSTLSHDFATHPPCAHDNDE